MRLDKLSRLVFQPSHFQTRALGRAVFHIANRTHTLHNAAGHALIAVRCHGIARPVNHLADTGAAVAPFIANGTEMIGEGEGRTTTVLANRKCNIVTGQLQTGVGSLNSRVIPSGDLIEENIDVHIPGQF